MSLSHIPLPQAPDQDQDQNQDHDQDHENNTITDGGVAPQFSFA